MIYSFHPFNKHTNIRVDFNIWYGNMNQISNYWKEKSDRIHKKGRKKDFKSQINAYEKWAFC